MSKKDLFAEENATKGSSNWKPEKVGDKASGYFMSKSDKVNTLKGDNSLQRVYVIQQENGLPLNIAGRVLVTESTGKKVAIFPGFESLKIGQLCGVKFEREEPSKKAGYNATKICKTFAADEFNDDVVKKVLEGAFQSTDGSSEPF